MVQSGLRAHSLSANYRRALWGRGFSTQAGDPRAIDPSSTRVACGDILGCFLSSPRVKCPHRCQRLAHGTRSVWLAPLQGGSFILLEMKTLVPEDVPLDFCFNTFEKRT